MGHPSRDAGFVPNKTIVRGPETKQFDKSVVCNTHMAEQRANAATPPGQSASLLR
jgi:hypothetical protein